MDVRGGGWWESGRIRADEAIADERGEAKEREIGRQGNFTISKSPILSVELVAAITL